MTDIALWCQEGRGDGYGDSRLLIMLIFEVVDWQNSHGCLMLFVYLFCAFLLGDRCQLFRPGHDFRWFNYRGNTSNQSNLCQPSPSLFNSYQDKYFIRVDYLFFFNKSLF